MKEANRKTRTITITISEKLNKDIEKIFLETGLFSNFSDFVNTTVAVFIGKLNEHEHESNFDFTSLHILQNEEKLTVKRSLSINFYLDDRLQEMAYNSKLKKNVIIRICIYNFLNMFQNPNRPTFLPSTENNFQKMPKTAEQLEDFIIKTFEKIDRK